MSTIKYLTNIDLRGNKLLNASLGEIGNSSVPYAFGVNAEGYLVVNDGEGNQRRYATMDELETAIRDALAAKLNVSGGELTGPVTYAADVTIQSETQLVHKAYVDAAFDAAVAAGAPTEGEFISISETAEISVDRQALNAANGLSQSFAADVDGVVDFTHTVSPDLGSVGRMKWVTYDADGVEVDFRIVFNVAENKVTVLGQGAGAEEAFTLSGQA